MTNKELTSEQSGTGGVRATYPAPPLRSGSHLAAAALSLTVLIHAAHASEAENGLCPSGTWNPKVEFRLEGANYKETLAWLSGWSYSLTAVGRSEAKSETPRFCLPKCGMIMGKPLLDFLNDTFKGQTITSEQAAGALWGGIQIMYKCKEK